MSLKIVSLLFCVILATAHLSDSKSDSGFDFETNDVSGIYREKAEKELGETPEKTRFALKKLRELFAGKNDRKR